MSFKVTTEYDSLRDFPAWSGGEETLNAIIDADKIEEADELAEEMFADETPTDTDVNDWLWFDLPDEMHLYDEENEEGDEAPDMTDEEETPVDDEQGIPVVPRTDDEAVADTDNDPENTNFDVKNESIHESIIKKTAHTIGLSELEDKILAAVGKFYGKALDREIHAVADDTIVGTFKFPADTFGDEFGDVDKAELSEMFKNPGSPLNDVSIRRMDVKHTSNGDILKIQFDVTHITVMEENTKKSAIGAIAALNESSKNHVAARSLREDMTDDDESGSLAQVAEAIMDNPEISQYIDGYDSSDGVIDFKLTNGHNVMVYVYDKLSGELGVRFDDENGEDLYSYNTACQGAPYGEITDRSVDGITKMLIKDIKKDVEEE